jgi:hypothetical protein
VLGGALGLIYSELIARDSRSMVELLNPLMSWIVLPYLGASAAREQHLRSLKTEELRAKAQLRTGRFVARLADAPCGAGARIAEKTGLESRKKTASDCGKQR